MKIKNDLYYKHQIDPFLVKKMIEADYEQALFEERTEINQFLRDGAFINDLYDLTLGSFFSEPKVRIYEQEALRTFNSAYKICWLATSRHASFSEITDELYFRRGDYLVRDLSYLVAWSILTVYKQFYDFDDTILNLIRKRNTHKELFPAFRELVKMQEDPLCPICFSNSSIHLVQDSTCLDFDADHLIDDRLGSNPDETLDNAISSIHSVYKAVKKQNTFLVQTIEMIAKDQQKTIENKDSLIARLRAETQTLRIQLAEKETKVEIKEVVKEVVVKEENPLAKILNWHNITDYAKSLGDAKEVQTILNMLNRLSTRNHYFDEDFDKNVAELEEYLRSLQRPFTNKIYKIKGDYVEKQTNNPQAPLTYE